MIKGKFITFEGGEGTGKSTQVRNLAKRLEDIGQETLVTREPGGSPRAEKIREALLKGQAKPFGPLAETLLLFAARDDHLEKSIRPALKNGVWVLCDRFSDSTRAYQGAAGGVRSEVISKLEKIVIKDTFPDLTLVLDLPAEDGLARASARRIAEGGDGPADRFENMDMKFHRKLRQAFLAIAQIEPERCVVIDASAPEDAVDEKIWQVVSERLDP